MTDENIDPKKTKIRVVGVGGGGSSIVSEIAPRISKRSVTFATANTDQQDLEGVPRKCKTFQFGKKVTRGLGTGMDPELGKSAAENAKEKIKTLFDDKDLSILVATLGGGVGSGATPVFAEIAKSLDNTTLGVFTLPFDFEGKKKNKIAKESLKEISPYLSAYSVIPNERIFNLTDSESEKIDKDTPLTEAFSAMNTILADFLEGLIEVLYLPGTINIDWADLETVLHGQRKLAYLNSVTKEGPQKAKKVAESVLNSPIYDYEVDGAERILYNIVGGNDLKITEVEKVSNIISDVNNRAKIIFGVSQDKDYQGKIKVTLLGVGCENEKSEKSGKKEKDKKKEDNKKKDTKKSEKDKDENDKNNEKDEEDEGDEKNSKEKKDRRNALDLKEKEKKAEEEIKKEEEKWDPPAFLRKED
ncbi:MAG: cell division protein FtsZ [Candidatus Paceibacterota bacterium]